MDFDDFGMVRLRLVLLSSLFSERCDYRRQIGHKPTIERQVLLRRCQLQLHWFGLAFIPSAFSSAVRSGCGVLGAKPVYGANATPLADKTSFVVPASHATGMPPRSSVQGASLIT